MKLLNKKRLEALEKALVAHKRLARCAMICYDPCAFASDADFLTIDARIVFVLPDNGRRCSDGSCVPKGSFLVRYG